VLRTPFRIAFLPLRLVGFGFESAAAYAGPRFIDPQPIRPPIAGPRLSPRFTLGGVKDVGVGPALSWNDFPRAGGRLTMSATLSSVDRRIARLRETVGDRRPVGFNLRADYDYDPSKDFYGVGNQSLKSNASIYLLATTDVEATLHFGASPLRRLRLLAGYSSLGPRRGYFGTPLLEDVFAPVDVPFEHRATADLVYGVAGDLAKLDDARDPSLGVHGRVDVRHGAGLTSADPDYDQWRVEARAYLPVFAKRRVIAVRGVYAGIDPRGGATTLPYYRLVRNEGTTSFAAYSSERFLDRQLLLGRIEYRWMVLYRISVVALYELGEVAPRAGAFTVDDAHRSYGGGLRLGLSDRATARFEVAKGSEGMLARFEIGGDF